jgi:hypothetical protein
VTKIAVGLLAYKEDPSVVEGAIASIYGIFDIGFVCNDNVPIESEWDEARVRQGGLDLARESGADWYLQLDADERLVNGRLLREFLEAHGEGLAAWPLPYVYEGGEWVTLAPFKLVRARARFELACDVFSIDGRLWLMSGYPWIGVSERDTRLLQRTPYLLHAPSVRPDARTRRRLSDAIEGTAGEVRLGVPQWPLPFIVPHARRLDMSEYTPEDGPYYCPACGRRYATVGICDDGHPLEQVVPVERADDQTETLAEPAQPATPVEPVETAPGTYVVPVQAPTTPADQPPTPPGQ